MFDEHRIESMERNINDLVIAMRELERSHNQMREVVFNGLRDKVSIIYQALANLATKDDLNDLRGRVELIPPEGKKPKRLEMLTGLMALMIAGQTLGIFDAMRLWLYTWLNGG